MGLPEFSCIANHVASDVFVSSSPEDEACPDAPYEVSKAKWQRWCKQPDLKHCFLSLYTGAAPSGRVSKDNPVREIRGLMVDYDLPVDLDEIAFKEDEILTPNFIHATKSKGCRIIYVFESPVAVSCRAFFDAFLNVASDELRLNSNGIDGMDEKAFKSPSQYFEVGFDWCSWNDEPVSARQTKKWAFKAEEKTQWKSAGLGVEIPWEVIEAEMPKKFPEIPWANLSFDSSCNRTTRFVDGGDATSVLLTPMGIHSHTGSEPWISWSDPRLLGPKLVRELSGNKIGDACEHIACLGGGQRFFIRDRENSGWRPTSPPLAKNHLYAARGLSRATPKGATCSEVEEGLEHIRKHNDYDGAAPFLFEGTDTLLFDGKRMLNTSQVRLVHPHPVAYEWGVKFPRIARYLEDVFDDENLPRFLSWCAHTLQAAHTNKPCLGLGLVLVGKPDVGKNFIIEGIIGQMLGGGMDASSLFLKGDQFNDELCRSALWMLNDPDNTDGVGRSVNMTKLLKKSLANTTFTCRAMGVSPTKFPMRSRIAMSINDDLDSLEAMPKMHASTLDKLCILHGTKSEEFGKHYPTNEELKSGPLPHLVAFLLDMEIPEELAGTRFGVKPFFDETVRKKAQLVSPEMDRYEIVRAFILVAGEKDPVSGNMSVTGTPAQLFELIEDAVPGAREAFRTPRVFSRQMGALCDNQGEWTECGLTVERKRIGKNRQMGFQIDCIKTQDYDES